MACTLINGDPILVGRQTDISVLLNRALTLEDAVQKILNTAHR